jgi:hypothetical protein
MGSLSILKRSIEGLNLPAVPRRILELGAGDGSLMLRLARAMKPPWHDVSLTMLDRHDLVGADTRAGYDAFGWSVTVVIKDVLEWALEPEAQHFDVCMATLFLHHFDTQALRVLMRAIAARTDVFIACEPRRNLLARVGSELIGLLGTNRVTRQDAVTSVAAGFHGRELTALWPEDPGANDVGSIDSGWDLQEHAVLPFTHGFTAVRRRVRGGQVM